MIALDCECTLESPQFCAKIRRIMYTPIDPSFTASKWASLGGLNCMGLLCILPHVETESTKKATAWSFKVTNGQYPD